MMEPPIDAAHGSRRRHSPEQITMVTGLDNASPVSHCWYGATKCSISERTHTHHLSFDSKLLPGLLATAADENLRRIVSFAKVYYGGAIRPALYTAANYPIAETYGTELDETRLLSCAATSN